MSHKFFRFLVIGGIATVLHYAVFAICVFGFGMAPVPASSTGFLWSALVNYFLNKRYTFQSDRAHRQALPRFAVTALMGLLWNASLLALFVQMGMLVWLAQVITTVAVLGWNFLVNSRWAFHQRAAPAIND